MIVITLAYILANDLVFNTFGVQHLGTISVWPLSSAKQHLGICFWLRQTAGGHFSQDNKQNENPNTRLRAIISPSVK